MQSEQPTWLTLVRKCECSPAASRSSEVLSLGGRALQLAGQNLQHQPESRQIAGRVTTARSSTGTSLSLKHHLSHDGRFSKQAGAAGRPGCCELEACRERLRKSDIICTLSHATGVKVCCICTPACRYRAA